MELENESTKPSAQIVLEEEGFGCGCTDDLVCLGHLEEACEEARSMGYSEGHRDNGPGD